MIEIVQEIVVEHKPKKDHVSDDEEEEEDRSPSSDDESVVHIDDPDPLAMMYMTIHGHSNSKRTQGQSSSVANLKSLIYSNSSSSSSSSGVVVVPNTGSRSIHRPTSCEVIDLQSDEDERVDVAIGYDSDCLIVEDYNCSVTSNAPDGNTSSTDVMRSDPLLPLDANGLPISLSEQRQKQLKHVAINRSRFVPSLVKTTTTTTTHAPKPVAPTVIDRVAVPTIDTEQADDASYRNNDTTSMDSCHHSPSIDKQLEEMIPVD